MHLLDTRRFNVQVIANTVFVTFAKPDAQKHDDVAGLAMV
jgi:hypothetical protein